MSLKTSYRTYIAAKNESSFRNTERTGTGMSLVSSFMRNAACSLAKRSEQSPCILPHFDTLSERLTTLSVPCRVFRLASEPLAHAAKQVNDEPFYLYCKYLMILWFQILKQVQNDKSGIKKRLERRFLFFNQGNSSATCFC